MSTEAEAAPSRLEVGDVVLAAERYGTAGGAVLFLHGEDGLLFCRPFLSKLGERSLVTAPSHPGWPGSARPAYVRTLDDVAYVYLDVLEAFDGPVALVGASMGGWLAAEIATKCQHRLSALVLVAPLGIKVGGTRDRTFADLWATDPGRRRQLLYGDVERAPDLSRLAEEDFADLALAEEAVARYGWEPHLYNPALVHRLRRIALPTLIIAGSADRFALDPSYFEHFASAIGDNASLTVVAGAGHRVEEEMPETLAGMIGSFLSEVE